MFFPDLIGNCSYAGAFFQPFNYCYDPDFKTNRNIFRKADILLEYTHVLASFTL